MKKHFLSALIIALILFFLLPCYGQKKDTLLGFVGTWKNKTTFTIDSNLYTGAKGGIISITPAKKINISTPGVSGYNKKIDEAIKEAEKDAQKIPADIAKDEGVSQATLAKKVQEQLSDLKDDLASLKIKDIDIGKGQNAQASCTAMEMKYNELIAFYTAHEKDKKYNLPPPPEADYFNCWFCDKQKQKDFDEQAENYTKLFAKTERDYIGDGSKILTELQIDVFTGVQNPNQPACAVDGNKLTSILYWLNARIRGMAKQLIKDNNKNYKTVMPVVAASAFADHFARNPCADPNMDVIYAGIGLYQKLRDTLMTQLKKEKDYTLLSAIPFMLYLDRKSKILTGDGENMDFLYKTLDVGRFKLTVEMDIKMGKDGGYIIAHLKGKSKMIYELDSADCLHIVPAWKENSGSSNWNNISMNVINLEMISPKGTPPKYIGTKTYRSNFPKLKFNFCKQGTDSVYFQEFIPDPVSDGTWLYIIPQAPPQRVPSGLMGTDRMFIDINDLQDDAQQIKAPPAMDEAALKEIQKISDDMQKTGVTADKMKKIQELTQKTMQQAQEVTLPISNFKFAVNVQNKNAVLLDQSFDAKQINPQFADKIVYGYFKIKLEEDSGKKASGQ